MAVLQYCKVVGKFSGIIGDTNGDADENPDFIHPTGKGVISCTTKVFKIDGTPQQIAYAHDIHVDVDANGNLAHNGVPYIYLLAPGDGVLPAQFQYKVVINLTFNNAKPVTYGPIYFNPVAGAEINLFNATATSSSVIVGDGSTVGGTTYTEDPNNPGFFIPA